MMDRNDMQFLVDALCAEADKLPMAEWATLEQLADNSPDLEKVPDGGYRLAGGDLTFTAKDLDDAALEVWSHVEERGLFFDYGYTEEGFRFSVRELAAPGSYGFDEVESLVLRHAASLNPFDDTVFSYDGESLTMTGGRDVLARRTADREMLGSMQELLGKTGALGWDREYHRFGVLDGWEWKLTVLIEGGRAFCSEASNEWPGTFGELWDGLCGILGVEGGWENPFGEEADQMTTLEKPYFMENPDWYVEADPLDVDNWHDDGRIFHLTDDAPQEAVDSYNEFYGIDASRG